MVDRKVTVTATMDASGMVKGAKEAEAAVERTGKAAKRAADTTGDAAKQQQTAFQRMAKSAQENERVWTTAGAALAGFGTVTAAGLAMSTKAAIDWESAFAGVKKTVNDSAAGYEALSDELRGMARSLPASHEAIAGVAEAAGQLGISRENITSFTRTMIDLGETTNLSADEATTSLARFSNIMGTSQSEMSNLGSAIVDLGNNYATTEREIVAMSLRLAGAGRQAKLSEGEVLGLATALSSVGIEAEAGGTAFSRVLIEMGTAVDSQSSKLSTFAEVAGMSADQFSTAWRDNAGSAIAAFIEGLGKIEASGESVQPVLEELGMTDIRVGDALRRASAASDLFTDAMGRGNQAYAENTALGKEAEQRYATTAAQLGVLKNNIVDLATSLGQVFLPALNALAEGGADLAAWLGGLPEPLKQIAAFSGAAASGTALLGGAFLLAAPRALETYKALQALHIIGPKTSAAMRGLAGVLTGPWGLAFAGAGVAIGAFIAHQAKIKAQVDEVRATLDDQTGAVTENTRAWAANEAATEGALKWAEDLGLKAGVVTDALLGNADAQRQVAEAANEASLAAVQNSDAWGAVDSEYANAADSGRRLVDFIEAKTGVVMEATEQDARARAEMEAGVRTADHLAVETKRLTAQAEAYLASQEAATRAIQDWNPAAERAAAVGEEAAQAYADWVSEMSGFSSGFVSASGALDAVNAKTQEWAQAQADATESADDSWEDFFDGQSVSVDEWISELERMAQAQADWETNMVSLSGRVSQSVIDELSRLGPEGAPLVAELVNASDEELARLEAVMGDRARAGSHAYATSMADAAPIIRAAASMWGQDIADEIAEQLASGEATAAEIVEMYDLAATIEILGDPLKYNETLNAGIALGDSSITTPKIDGDPARFEKALNASLALGNGETATPDIAGNSKPFLTALNSALATGNRASSTSKILGSSVPFMGTLNAALWAADRASATADLHLNTWNAMSALRGFLGSIPRSVSVALNAIPFMPRIPGFMAGGYTGDVSPTQIAGVTHGQEFVSTASTVADPYNRQALEFMHAGRSMREWTPPALPAQGRVSDGPSAPPGPVDLSRSDLDYLAAAIGRRFDAATSSAEHTRRRLARAEGKA